MIYINGQAVAPTITVNPEYLELDYIASTGTQYIDTGYLPTNNTKVIITLSDVVDNCVVFSASNAWDYNIFCLTYQLSGSWGFRWMPSNDGIKFKYGYNTPKATIELYKLQVKYNDEVISSSTSDINCGHFDTLRVLGGNRFSDATLNASQFKLYALQIYENNVLQRSYIPVLKDYVPCLYEQVTGEYKYNDGTGTFNYALKEVNS